MTTATLEDVVLVDKDEFLAPSPPQQQQQQQGHQQQQSMTTPTSAAATTTTTRMVIVVMDCCVCHGTSRIQICVSLRQPACIT